MPFQNTWAQIQNIPINTQIQNWTAYHGYRGDPITIAQISPDHIVFLSPTADNEQPVPKDDFEGVYNVWNQYIAGHYQRRQICDDITRFSRYIINTFKLLCVNNNGNLP